MAVIKFTNSKSTLKHIISYVTKETKTTTGLITGKDCTSENALIEMQSVKNIYNKNGGRQYIHMVQSFHPNDDITYEKAHEIGLKMAEQYKGFQVLVATHMDKTHIHNHLIINSVSFENGKKFQQSNRDMERIKEYSNKLCAENGFVTIPKKSNSPALSQAEYQVAVKGQSWKMKLTNAIDYAMENAADKESFIINMKQLGYGVTWTDTRKYITYATPDGMKCRDNKLYDIKYLKENMENGFSRIKREKQYNATETRTNTIEVLSNTRGELDSIATSNKQSKNSNQRFGIQSRTAEDETGEISGSFVKQYDKSNRSRNKMADERISQTFAKETHKHSNRDTNRDCTRYYSNTPLETLVSLAFIFQSRPKQNNKQKRTIRSFRGLSKQAQREWIFKNKFSSSVQYEDEMEM